MRVQRCRFVDYVPDAIQSLALSKEQDCKKPKLAASRSNGNIEIYDILSGFCSDVIIPGGASVSVECLGWCGDRLFSCSLSGKLTEWNIGKGIERYSIDCNSGPIWSIAVSPDNTRLAVGCEDGSVRVFKVEEFGLEYEQRLVGPPGRVLCVSWSLDSKTLAFGNSKSCLSLYNLVDEGKQLLLHQICVGHDDMIIWCCCILDCGSVVVTGDSDGRTCFWDVGTGTLLSSHSSHQADILCICQTGKDSVISSGIDHTIVQFRRNKIGGAIGNWSRIGKNAASHTHDIRSMGFQSYRNGVSVYVSGGLDTKIVISTNPVDRVSQWSFRTVSTANSKVTIVPDYILLQKDLSLNAWQIDDQGCHKRLFEMKVQGPEFINCSSISPNGKFVVACTKCESKVFRITYEDSESLPNVSSLAKHEFPVEIPGNVMKCLFSADSSKLYLVCFASISVISLGNCDEDQVLVQIPLKSDETRVRLACLSDDGCWMALVNADSTTDIYNMDSQRLHCTIPPMKDNSIITAIQFGGSQILYLASSKPSQSIHKFNVETRKLSFIHRASLPALNPIQSISHIPNSEKLILSSHEGIWSLDMQSNSSSSLEKRKRKPTDKENNENPDDIKVEAVKRLGSYSSILAMRTFSVGDEHSLVVVERPWLSILENLPPPFLVKKFGS